MKKLTLLDVMSEQVFTHIDDDGRGTTIAVDRLVAHLVASGAATQMMELEPGFAQVCRERRGVEQPRVDRLNVFAVASQPVLMLDMNDGTHLLADGTHRYVWAVEHGLKVLRAFIVPFADWQDFIVYGVEDETALRLVTGPSGVLS